MVAIIWSFGVALSLLVGGMLWQNGQVVALARQEKLETMRAIIGLQQRHEALRRDLEQWIKRCEKVTEHDATR